MDIACSEAGWRVRYSNVISVKLPQTPYESGNYANEGGSS